MTRRYGVRTMNHIVVRYCIGLAGITLAMVAIGGDAGIGYYEWVYGTGMAIGWVCNDVVRAVLRPLA